MNRTVLMGGAALFTIVIAIGAFVAMPASGAPGDAPDTVIDSGPSGPTNVSTPSFGFHSTQSESTFECSVDTGTAAFGPCVEPTPALADGSYTFRVRAINAEAIVDDTPATRDFTVDTTPPETIIDSAPSGTTEASELMFSFHSSEPGSTFECSTDTGTPAFKGCVKDGEDLEDGPYTYRVRATDRAGNVDPTPATSAFTLVEPPPVYGKTVNLQSVSGTVRVKIPGSNKFVVLGHEAHVKVGSVLDASAGRVHIVSAKSKHGSLQGADFYSGRFIVLQPAKGTPVTILKLASELACGDARRSGASASRSKKKGNGLWGSGHGNYKTVGSYGSATVRGTVWFTQDLCDGTFFHVTLHDIVVKDFTRHRTVTVKQGSTYFAPAP